MQKSKEKAITLFNEGYSYQQIADELGISKSKAYRLVNESEEETVSETVSQNIPKHLKKSTKNPETDFKIRKLEYEHEKEMFKLKADEEDRKRNFDEYQQELISENNRLDVLREDLEEKISELEEEINHLKEELQYEPAIPEDLVDEVTGIIVKIRVKLGEEVEEDEYETIVISIWSYISKVISHCLELEARPVDIPGFEIAFQLQKEIEPTYEKLRDRGAFSSSTAKLEISKDLNTKIQNFSE